MSGPTRRYGRRTGVIVALTFLGGALLGSRLSAPVQPAPPIPAPTEITRVMPLEPTLAPASAGCDQVDQLFVGMFAALTDAALANAGIDRSAFNAALEGDRETLRRYLDEVGIAVDDAQLDELMRTGFPSASDLPIGAAGDC